MMGNETIPNLEHASIPCNLCGQTGVIVLARECRSGSPLRTVACSSCGLSWSDPRPHDARAFYREQYRLAYKDTFEPKPKHVLRAGRVAASRLEQIRSLLRPGLRALDVGSGGGEFAYLLGRAQLEVEGVEPNQGYARHSIRHYGLNVRVGFIDEVKLPAARYDLITAWHVLEHIEDPQAVLQQLCNALRPDGRLVVEVPNLEGPRRNRSSTFHEAHLYNFNAATLKAMAARSGLRAMSIVPSPDGGNLLAVFCPGETSSVDAVLARLSDNPAQVAGRVIGHSAWRYWLSARPYLRMLRQCWRPVSEYAALWPAMLPRQRLDQLYDEVLEPQTFAQPQPVWQILVGAYLLALLLEWLLLDTSLPLRGWSEHQGFWLFTTLLLCGAGLAWYSLRDRRPRGQLLGMGALASPLFALPVYC